MSKSFTALLGFPAIALVIAGSAHAHSRLVSPPPRDVGVIGNDAHKDPTGPCGVAKTNRVTFVPDAGATVHVKWEETVNHPGCFLLSLSSDGDKTFTLLKNVTHDGDGGTPRPYEADVTLPAGLRCTNCTLQLRQIMMAAESPTCDADSGTTYYSCADLAIVDVADGGIVIDGGGADDAGGDAGNGVDAGPLDPMPDDDAGAPSASGVDSGARTSRVDAGNDEAPGGVEAESAGCSTSPVGPGGAGFLLALGVGAAFVARRRLLPRR